MDMIEEFYIGVPGAIRSTEFALPFLVRARQTQACVCHT
jgi:hypothetical protein